MITWPEIVARTADAEWTWTECIHCGSTEVRTRGLILEDGPSGVLRRVAWCSRKDCDIDREETDYLHTPRTETASPLPPRKVIVLHMVYPDGTHTGDCAGCLWVQEQGR